MGTNNKADGGFSHLPMEEKDAISEVSEFNCPPGF